VLVHRGQRGQSYEYELLHDQAGADGQASGPHLSGLIDTAQLAATTQSSRGAAQGFAGQSENLAGALRPHHGANAGGARELPTTARPHGAWLDDETTEMKPPARATPITAATRVHASYPQSMAA
jgi:hypothetical protein